MYTLKIGDDFTRITTSLNDTASPEKGWTIDSSAKVKGVHMWVTRGLTRVKTDEITAGDIVWLAGPPQISIGDTDKDSKVCQVGCDLCVIYGYCLSVRPI